MSTSYPADFPAERAYDAVEPEVFLWVDPLFYGGIALLLLAVAAFAWWLGRYQASRQPDAAESIWRSIDDAAKAAMKADNHAIPAKAQHLYDVIEKKLGKTLKIAGGLKLKALKDALAGRGPATGDANTGNGRGGSADADARGSAAAAASAGNVTIVSVGQGGSTTTEPPPPPPPPSNRTRDLTADERNDALRLAVAGVNEHWRHRGDRIADLRAAHAELSGH